VSRRTRQGLTCGGDACLVRASHQPVLTTKGIGNTSWVPCQDRALTKIFLKAHMVTSSHGQCTVLSGWGSTAAHHAVPTATDITAETITKNTLSCLGGLTTTPSLRFTWVPRWLASLLPAPELVDKVPTNDAMLAQPLTRGARVIVTGCVTPTRSARGTTSPFTCRMWTRAMRL
jgi:hypothetical protein